MVERLQAYLVKAAREAKRVTSWLNPDPEYEAALSDFAAQLLARPERSAFLRDFTPFAATVAHFGRINSLAQTALKITSPGVPDFYQGTELCSLSLVDPDNRRPVDFAAAARWLDAIRELPRLPPTLLAEPEGNAAKLHLTAKLLALRRRDPDLFARGAYRPLQIEGECREHALAFARSHEGRALILVVPRWSAKLMQGVEALPLGARVWADTRLGLEEDLPQGPWTDVLTGRELGAEQEVGRDSASGERAWRLADVLAEFPIAVLYSGHER